MTGTAWTTWMTRMTGLTRMTGVTGMTGVTVNRLEWDWGGGVVGGLAGKHTK